MKIVECDDSHRRAWNTFVERQGCFYHRFEWRDVNNRCLSHQSCYLAAIEGEDVVGVLPVVRVRSLLFGNIGCSMPFVNYGGPCTEEPLTEKLLVDRATEIARLWQVDYLEIRTPKKLHSSLPTSEHKVSMSVDLTSGCDALWTNFTHSHRKDIKRGYRGGVSVRFGGSELLNDFYTVISEAWRNMGTPIYSKRYFENVAHVLQDFVRLCVVYKDGAPAAASFQAYDRGIAEGLWLGCSARYREQYLGYVLYWEILQDAVRRGCHTFHLGRSTSDSGAEAYKRKWNAYPTQLYWQYVLGRRKEIPSLNVSNPKFKLAIKTWQQLPVRVTRIVGPPLARIIP